MNSDLQNNTMLLAKHNKILVITHGFFFQMYY